VIDRSTGHGTGLDMPNVEQNSMNNSQSDANNSPVIFSALN
jgi:hypothetical protein